LLEREDRRERAGAAGGAVFAFSRAFFFRWRSLAQRTFALLPRPTRGILYSSP
jgi:hypothetical protein